MPVYEYYCELCDELFTQLRPMSEYREPANCPTCAIPAEHVVATAPRLNTMHVGARDAHQVNERSAHEPRVTRPHTCGAGCNHQHAGKAQPKVKQQNDKRPWMLGH
jgi:putative FmdB family regulatory protein